MPWLAALVPLVAGGVAIGSAVDSASKNNGNNGDQSSGQTAAEKNQYWKSGNTLSVGDPTSEWFGGKYHGQTAPGGLFQYNGPSQDQISDWRSEAMNDPAFADAMKRTLARQTGDETVLANNLRDIAAGKGESAAYNQMKAGSEDNLANMIALARSQRGPGASTGAYNAMQAGSKAAAKNNMDAGTLRAQESAQARQEQAALYGNMSKEDQAMMQASLGRQGLGYQYGQLGADAASRDLAGRLAQVQNLTDIERINAGQPGQNGSDVAPFVQAGVSALGAIAGAASDQNLKTDVQPATSASTAGTKTDQKPELAAPTPVVQLAQPRVGMSAPQANMLPQPPPVLQQATNSVAQAAPTPTQQPVQTTGNQTLGGALSAGMQDLSAAKANNLGTTIDNINAQPWWEAVQGRMPDLVRPQIPRYTAPTVLGNKLSSQTAASVSDATGTVKSSNYDPTDRSQDRFDLMVKLMSSQDPNDQAQGKQLNQWWLEGSDQPADWAKLYRDYGPEVGDAWLQNLSSKNPGHPFLKFIAAHPNDWRQQLENAIKTPEQLAAEAKAKNPFQDGFVPSDENLKTDVSPTTQMNSMTDNVYAPQSEYSASDVWKKDFGDKGKGESALMDKKTADMSSMKGASDKISQIGAQFAAGEAQAAAKHNAQLSQSTQGTGPSFIDELIKGGGYSSTLNSGMTMKTDVQGAGGLGTLNSGVTMKQDISSASSAQLASDEKGKDARPGGETVADGFLHALATSASTFKYKDPSDEPSSTGPTGKDYLGVMAQAIERSPTGDTIVKEGPKGKVLDYGPTLSAALAGIGRLHERLDSIEETVGKKRKKAS